MVSLGFVVILLGGCHLDCCLIANVFDHLVDGHVPKVDVLFLEGCKWVIAHTIEDEPLACLLGSEVFCVAHLLFLVVGDKLFLLGCTDACTQCCRSIRPWACRWSIRSRVVGNHELIFCLRDDTRKVAVALPFSKVGGLQDGEYPPNLSSRLLMASGVMTLAILVMASFCMSSILYVPFFVSLDILLLLVEAVARKFLLLFLPCPRRSAKPMAYAEVNDKDNNKL